MILAFAALLSLGIILAGAFYLARNLYTGFCLLMIANGIIYFFGFQQINFGPLHVSVQDPINVMLVLAGIIRTATRFHLPGTMRLLGYAFITILLIGMVRGVLDNGVPAVGVEGREFIGAIATILYFASLPADVVLIKRLTAAYIALGVFTIFCTLSHYAGIPPGVFVIDDFGKERVMPANAAEVMALSVVLCVGWVSHWKNSVWLKVLAGVLFSLAIFLQHRTVWNVLIGCVLASILVDPKAIRRFLPAATIAVAVLALLALGVYGSGAEASRQFEDSATNTGTWDYRVEQWILVVTNRDQSLVNVLIGEPMGTPQLRYSALVGWDSTTVHSEYVVTYQRFGILGCITWFSFLFYPIFNLLRPRFTRYPIFPSSSTWFVVVIGVLIYAITYHVETDSLALVGLCHAMLNSQTERSTAQAQLA